MHVCYGKVFSGNQFTGKFSLPVHTREKIWLGEFTLQISDGVFTPDHLGHSYKVFGLFILVSKDRCVHQVLGGG